MTQTSTLDAHGALIENSTLKIQRLLPGPLERIWSYLTQSELRRQWLAAGSMDMQVGSTFEWVWRNDELSKIPSQRPAGHGEEHRMTGRITELEPPYKLSITWGSTGGVTFELAQQGDQVLLTVLHRRVLDRTVLLNVSAGWHMHLDLLALKVAGKDLPPYWEGWVQLRREYEARLPA